MSAQPDPSQSSAGQQVGPADPEHDPTASYALDPAYVRALTSRVVATTGREVPTYTPLTGQPLAMIPQSSEADVKEAFARARRAQQAWAQTSLEQRAAGAAAAARPRPRPAGRDHRPDLLGVRQGPQARLRRAAAHRADGPLLRAHGARPPRHRAQARRRARADPRRGQPRAQGRRRDHLAVELPVHDGAVRRAARAARRQRGRHQARRPDDAVRAARRRSCSRRPASPRACGTSWPARAASSAAPIIERADYICFTGSTATGTAHRPAVRRPADRLLARARRQEPDPGAARRRPRPRRRGCGAGELLQRRPAVRLDGADVRRRPGLRPVPRQVRRADARRWRCDPASSGAPTWAR